MNKVVAIASLFLYVTSAIAEPILGTPDIDDIEYPDDEPHSAEEVDLGKTLFFDTRLSLNKNNLALLVIIPT